MQSIRGKCHCGNISHELEWPETGRKLRVRACGCSFCTKHGGAYTSHPAARLTARVTDPSVVNEYTFGTETATLHFLNMFMNVGIPYHRQQDAKC